MNSLDPTMLDDFNREVFFPRISCIAFWSIRVITAKCILTIAG